MAQESPFRTSINALSCARELTITDLKNSPLAAVAHELKASSFAVSQSNALTPEVSARLNVLFGQVEAFAETERQSGGADTGLANALGAFGATLDANAWLGSTDMILSMVNIAAILIELNCREDALRLMDEALPFARNLFADSRTKHYLIAVLFFVSSFTPDG